MGVDRTRSSRTTVHARSRFQTLILVCLVAIMSYLVATLGGILVLRPQMVWPLWPGCAFLIAVLLVVPRKIWPILITAGLAGFVLYDLQAGLTLRSTTLFILSDTLEVLIAALGVSYSFKGVPRLNSVKSLAKYSLFAVVLAPVSSPTWWSPSISMGCRSIANRRSWRARASRSSGRRWPTGSGMSPGGSCRWPS